MGWEGALNNVIVSREQNPASPRPPKMNNRNLGVA